MVKTGYALLLASVALFAQIPAETPLLDSAVSAGGTWLISMPTYVYGRSPGQAGLHAEDEWWSPERAGKRHLPNRYSNILNWNLAEPGVWFRTGNEVGDLLYQELLDDTKADGGNRTPMLDGGLVSPEWKGFRVGAQGSQVDHFSSETLSERTRRHGDMSFAWFGENLPAFSTFHAGAGYRYGLLSGEMLAGRDYVWAQTRTRRWVPVEISPRIQAHAGYGRLNAHVSYEKQEFTDRVLNTAASKQIVNGEIRMACLQECRQSTLVLGGGLRFRHEKDSSAVPWSGQENVVAWPWLELSLRLTPWLNWSGYAGINDQDKILRDSLEATGRSGAWLYRLGWLHALGTTLDPLGYERETYRGDTLELKPEGYHHLQKLYAEARYIRSSWTWKNSVWGWSQRGAETFTLTDSLQDNGIWLRQGLVERVDAWLSGLGASAGLDWSYQQWFTSGVEGGWEHFRGPVKRMETSPAQGYLKLNVTGELWRRLRITHEWIYRSATSWNQDAGGNWRAPGGWNWNAMIQQSFPEYNLELQAVWLHVNAIDWVQAPYGGRDRTRFYCGLRKAF